MQEKTKKLITWLCLGIAILGSVFAILFAMNQEKFGGLYNIAYGILLFFVAVSLLAILFFLVKSLIKGGSKGLLIGAGALIVVLVVSFLLSKGNDVSEVLLERNDISQAGSKIIGMGCYTVYILLAVTVVAMVYVECTRIFKKK